MKNIKLSFLILCTTLFSTLACIEGPNVAPPSMIYSLAVYENRIYASVNSYFDQYLISFDDGRTWDMKSKYFLKETFSLPDQVIEELKQYPELPVTVCLPA